MHKRGLCRQAVSVWPSVCHALWILSKRVIISSNFFTTPFYFCITTGTPYVGVKCVGYKSDFQPLSCFISKMIQVTLELPNGAISNDLEGCSEIFNHTHARPLCDSWTSCFTDFIWFSAESCDFFRGVIQNEAECSLVEDAEWIYSATCLIIIINE